MKRKVAICQESIIPGGRFRVMLGMIEILNEFGIEPDILTFRLNLKQAQIEKIYGKRPHARFRPLPHIPLLNEYSIIAFNAMLKYYAADYDLLINTSNSLLFLPENKHVLSYVFYPRESRIKADVYSIHDPEKVIKPYSLEFYSRKLLRRIYRYRSLHPRHRMIAMTQFTRAALESEYSIEPSSLPIIYPPVEIEDLKQKSSDTRRKDVVSIGRFVKDKRQIEQIHIASRLPGMNFHIVGFVGNKGYYKKCERLVEEMNLQNVHLYPNASHDQMTDILSRSRYFIHTLINEPFGITAVQGVAAGCLPIVHDSGGQREVIPYPQLRYESLEDIPDVLSKLQALSSETLDNLYTNLYQHVSKNYSETVFNEKMRAALQESLSLARIDM